MVMNAGVTKAGFRMAAALSLLALASCVSGGTDASAPSIGTTTGVVGAPGSMQTNGMMMQSVGSGVSATSDMDQGIGQGMSQSGTAMGAGGIGSGIPQ